MKNISLIAVIFMLVASLAANFSQLRLNQENERVIEKLRTQFNDTLHTKTKPKENNEVNKFDSSLFSPEKSDKKQIILSDDVLAMQDATPDDKTVIPEENGFVPMEKQKIDEEWAPEFTNKLTDAFQLSDDLYALGMIQSIECKTTLCQVYFQLHSPGDFGVGFTIQDALKQTELHQHGVVFEYVEKDNMMKLLIGKNKDSFEGIYQ